MSAEGSGNKAERIAKLDPCWPVLPGPRYRGRVWNHSTLADGTLITTSAVVELKDGRIVTRSGSIYELGRTFHSQEHAAAHAGVRLVPSGKPQPQQVLQVIDLESDELSTVDTFAHRLLPGAGRSSR